MRKLFPICLLFMAWLNAGAQQLISGADISWCTEMEADGKVFRNLSGEETDIFQLIKDLGMTAIRLRLWDNPTACGYGSWCDKADVVSKAKRAHELGLDVMIDFHYSDTFADPEHQNVPKAWEGMTYEEVKTALANHTKDVLQALKTEGISPKWVQVGNETNSGIAMMYGKIDWDKTGTERFANYVPLSNAGYDAVKSVFPEAYVIVHLGGTENARWFFPDFIAAGGKVDMIGLSHYPTEEQWDSSDPKATHSNINAEKYVKEAIAKFNVPVMLCETGFDVIKPQLAHKVMIDLFNRMRTIPQCAGIFYWEPEVDGQWKPAWYEKIGWGAYAMGAFTTDGIPTKALDAFGGRTVVNEYPTCLRIYDKECKKILATLLPKKNEDGIYSALIKVTTPWMNFQIFAPDNNVWYGSDPADKTGLSKADNKWNLWIDSEQTGVYDVSVNLKTMKWSHTFVAPTGISPNVSTKFSPGNHYYDLFGTRVLDNRKGIVIKNGRKSVVR